MKNNYLLIIFIIIIISISGCNNNYLKNKSIETESNNVIFKKKIASTSNRDIMPGTENLKGIRYRIYNSKGELDNEYNYYLNTGEEWDKFISISNRIDQSSTYNINLYVDYKQSSFKIDDKMYKSYTFNMNSNQTIEIPFTINKLSNGLHDVLILIAKDPNNKSLDTRYRATTLINNLIYFRFSIIVNNDHPQNYTLTKFQQKNLNDNFNNIVLNKSEEDVSPLYIDNVGINDTLHFYTHIGNYKFKQSQKYALITLIDWNQVPIQNENSIFFEVNKHKKIDILSEIKAPNSRGIHNITSILIMDPFEKVDKYNNQVFVSARVGLNVK